VRRQAALAVGPAQPGTGRSGQGAQGGSQVQG
jgi:hypothetical protein